MNILIKEFEKIANSKGNVVSLRYEEKDITYAQLDTYANKVCTYLINRGVKPGDRIAIVTNSYFIFIIASLGILKCRAVYVPIDSEYPLSRIEYIVKNSRSKITLGSSKCDKIDCIDLEEIINLESSKVFNINCNNYSDQDVVYIIYTSGSTGIPKGVEITNQSIMNYLLWAKKFYGKGMKVIFPVFTSISFDLTVTSIFLPLISGGKCHLIEKQDVYEKFMDLVNNSDVNAIKLTPSQLAILIENDLSKLSSLKLLIVGGEILEKF